MPKGRPFSDRAAEKKRGKGGKDFMKEQYEKLRSGVDGLKLDVLTVVPDGEVRGILQIHHGMSEYKERYLPFLRFMAGYGYAGVIHDCRGHGKSVRAAEDLGYMYGQRGKAVAKDTYRILQVMKKRWPGVPVILLGHSMGSLVVRTFVKQYDTEIDRLIVCGSPGKNRLLGMGKLLAALEKEIWGSRHRAKLIEALSFGPYARKFAAEKSRFAWCCSDPQVVEQYDSSPFCGFTFTVDGYQTLFSLMEETYSGKGWNCRNPDLPILFVAGREDCCTGGARGFQHAVSHMRHMGYRKVNFRQYERMRHEILNERDKEQVYQDILQFAEKALKET